MEGRVPWLRCHPRIFCKGGQFVFAFQLLLDRTHENICHEWTYSFMANVFMCTTTLSEAHPSISFKMETATNNKLPFVGMVTIYPKVTLLYSRSVETLMLDRDSIKLHQGRQHFKP